MLGLSGPTQLIVFQFVAYGRDIDYVLVQSESRHCIIAQDRLEYMRDVMGQTLTVLATLKGSYARSLTNGTLSVVVQ